MKEAAGEANVTVITIVLIALVMAAGALIIPRLLNGTAQKSACSELGGTLTGNTCTVGTGANRTCFTITCTNNTCTNTSTTCN